MTEFREKWPEMRMKHLELIQNAMARMGSNSTTLKGYTITVVGAVIALAAAVQRPNILLYALPVVIGMSVLDSTYLALEKGFRTQYNIVRLSKLDCEPDFEITPSYGSFIESYLSWSVAGFYGCTMIVMFLLYIAMT